MHLKNHHQLSIVCSCFTSVPIQELVLLFLVISSVQTSKDAVNHTICGDIDIRNNVTNFERLENCTVIEGVLQIVLIDQGDPSHYANLSFPKLREITGFLLLYRVEGLTTLANLFPNLAVIRGAKVITNYALIIFEMPSLQEIGLPSLTVISRGSVHIDKNPQLCYVNTIDWEVIVSKGKDDIFIGQNKEINQCPNNCPNNCPSKIQEATGKSTSLCWNKHSCQKLCTHCPNNACMKSENGAKGKCCYNQCLGGCDGGGRSDCFACTTVVYKGKCLGDCHPGTYMFSNRRCITDSECLNMNNKTLEYGKGKDVVWKLFNHTCISECPEGYMEDEQNKTICLPCNGPCPKECESITVDSISAAQALRGCTRIKGHLEIQIKGGSNIVQELEENMSSLKEVDDYVKITRSYPLMSLNFLKNLEKIHGKNKESSRYTFYVFENNNLLDLIPVNNSKLKILSGEIFFYHNPKLCKSKIETFLKMSYFAEFNSKDISHNGDRVACTVKNLPTFVAKVTSTAASVIWDNFKVNLSDPRSLLGYAVSYKEAPENVSMYDGRDACGADTWNVEDIGTELNDTDTVNKETFLLMNLKPFTRYAVYVKTNILVKEEDLGAQSDIIYFRTLPDVPSSPFNIKVRSTSPDSLIISWQPPSKPKGTITHYIINGFSVPYDRDYLYERNYCAEPIDVHTQSTGMVLTTDFSYTISNTTAKPTSLPTECCECSKKPSLQTDVTEVQISFEDSLHNHVYVKRNEFESIALPKRKKRAIVNNSTININELTTLGPFINDSRPFNTTNNTAQLFRKKAFFKISNITRIQITNMEHFSKYSIEIKACQDSLTGKEEDKLCSAKAITTATTAKKNTADDINSTSVTISVLNDTAGKVLIKWREPENPNGLIVTYQLEYKNTKIKNFKAIPVCITQNQYNLARGYTLVNLDSGNYSIRIRATSLADNGNWTEEKYFFITETAVGVNTEVIIISVVMSVLVLLIIVLVGIFLMKKYMHKIPDGILYASVNPEYMSTAEVYVPDEWEMLREKITIIRELGQGSFGMVYEGIVKDVEDGKPEIRCAVKTVNETASVRERIEFLNEASVMKAFNCHHVVKLIGVVSKGQPTLVIMELMANGDLKSYLRLHRPDSDASEKPFPPTLKRILQMACEIADGMAYLAAKKFVHRDLAARNCMVAEDLTVKIGDFGMTRDIYETDYYRKGGKGLLPVRWMAPESLKDGVFTSQSDVWSYGIVLWEMATLASQPYQGLSNEQVLKYVIEGGVMEKPENCPDRLYSLMGICWSHNPRNRPSFMELVNLLVADASPTFHQSSFYSTQLSEQSSYDVVDVDEVLPTTPLKNSTPSAPKEVARIEQNGHERNHLSDDADKDCYIQTSYPIKNVTKENRVRADEGSKIPRTNFANGHINFPVANNAEC